MGARDHTSWVNPTHNWYTRFDPVGPFGNVHYLLRNKTEYVAGMGAQTIAAALGATHVTLKLLKPRGKHT